MRYQHGPDGHRAYDERRVYGGRRIYVEYIFNFGPVLNRVTTFGK